MAEWLDRVDFSALEKAILRQEESDPELFSRAYQALADLLLPHPTLREQVIVTIPEATRILRFNSTTTVYAMIRDGLLLGFRLHEELILGRPNVGVIRRSAEELVEDPWVQEQRTKHIQLYEALKPLRELSENPLWGKRLQRVELRDYVSDPPPWATPEQIENAKNELKKLNVELSDVDDEDSPPPAA